MKIFFKVLLICFLIQPVLASEECDSSSKTVRVLAIDGGGVKDIIPALHLKRLEELVEGPLAETFDLIAGTSGGGLLSLGLTHEFSASQLIDMFESDMQSIFETSKWSSLWSLGGLLSRRYSEGPLEQSLKKQFEDSLFSKCIVPTLITSYDIKAGKPYFFKSWRAKADDRYNFYKWQVGRATSAAPTYLPAASFKSQAGEEFDFIDGGVVINNPTLAAVAEAKILFPKATDFLIVSLGTGATPQSLSESSLKNGGDLAYARPITGLMMSGANIITDYQMTALYPAIDGKQRYFRFQPYVPVECAALDNAENDNINALKAIALKSIEENDEKLQIIADELKQPRFYSHKDLRLTSLQTVDKHSMKKAFLSKDESVDVDESFVIVDK
ncbi:MAG: patatin-like phospholipase family protein [Alphaproteobacteria bacterium]|nr:patatin-like phospholipase family protein [Alphaproteobacteria bacterium]